MQDDTTDTAKNISFAATLYLHLCINLADNGVPLLHSCISRTSDGSLPLNSHEESDLGISVKIEPQYRYFRQLHSFPDEFLALCKHYKISNSESYMLHLYEERFGLIYFYPQPNLPHHWERQISDEGESSFYNKKTSAWRSSPAEVLACLSFSSFSYEEIKISF
jgi:hypothetical protein